jgi:hypothetical protein
MIRVRVLAAIAALAAMHAVSSDAEAASQIITLSATVPGYCTVGGGPSSTTSATVPITALDLPNTAAIPVTGLGAVVCNENTQLTLTTTNGGLTGPAAVAGFSNRIDYTASATYGSGATSTTQALTTNGTAGASAGPSTASTMGASNSQSFTVTVTPIAASPLLAGLYSDTLTVLFTPHL